MHLETLTKLPESNARPTPLLFVHGAWHDAWCWAEHFLPYFAQHGYISYRAFIDMLLSHPRPGREKIPVLVMGGARDTIYTRQEFEATARAYGTRAEIFPNMAHDLML